MKTQIVEFLLTQTLRDRAKSNKEGMTVCMTIEIQPNKFHSNLEGKVQSVLLIKHTWFSDHWQAWEPLYKQKLYLIICKVRWSYRGSYKPNQHEQQATMLGSMLGLLATPASVQTKWHTNTPQRWFSTSWKAVKPAPVQEDRVHNWQ